MRISIFPKAKALPENKEEKKSNTWFTSKPHLPEQILIENEDQLIDIICNNAWSPSIFTTYRNKDNFISTDFIVLDIDEGLTIEGAEKKVHELDLICLCIPSTSHTDDDHRFRLIFPTSRSIIKQDVFETTNRFLAEHFNADPSTLSDTSRFFYGGKLIDGFWYADGKLLVPHKPEKPKKGQNFSHELKEYVTVGKDLEELVEYLYGEKRTKVPEQISYFLENAPDGLSGEMYCRANSFLFTAALSGCKEDRIYRVFEEVYPYEITDEIEKGAYKIIKQGESKKDE